MGPAQSARPKGDNLWMSTSSLLPGAILEKTSSPFHQQQGGRFTASNTAQNISRNQRPPADLRNHHRPLALSPSGAFEARFVHASRVKRLPSEILVAMAPRPRANGVDTDASMSDAPEHPHVEEMVSSSI